MAADSPGDERTLGKYKVAMAISWAIVGIPLIYGIVSAIMTVIQLFTS